MRNISFSLTEEQFVDGSKDVTRRVGWVFLKPGDRLMACRKCQGLKPGEKLVNLGEIEVVSVRREKLNEMSRIGYGKTEAIREGFPHLSGNQFVCMFMKHMGGRPDQIITRIEFRKVIADAESYSPLVWMTHSDTPLFISGHLRGCPETTIFEIEISPENPRRGQLRGAFIPDGHESSRLYGPLAPVQWLKKVAYDMLDQWMQIARPLFPVISKTDS